MEELYVLVFVVTMWVGDTKMDSYALTNSPPVTLRQCEEMVNASSDFRLRCINVNSRSVQDAVRKKFGSIK